MSSEHDAALPSDGGASTPAATEVGNYFVANYPPFSCWRRDQVGRVLEILDSEPGAGVALGIYVHVPFCRKRCDFCYFRVYTDKDSRGINRYLDALIAELAMYSGRPRLRGRRPLFVYFGGGTPSYLSVEQLRRLFEGLQRAVPWEGAQEITFECEPGTLQEKKIEALRDLGVTRLSLGVENFDPEILALNNRAHRAAEIDRAYDCARRVGFPQINIDLIAGMVGETDDNWRQCVDRVRRMAPDSITIYQMEIPYNTTIYSRMKDGSQAPIADWETKRRWVSEAFAALEADGYRVGSAYTASRGPDVRFLYRDGLWRGADMLGLGVASFSHLGGVHFQNQHDFDPYVETVERGELPVYRALRMTDEEKLIRELVLQLKLGQIDARYFAAKFGVDVRRRFADALNAHRAAGYLRVEGDTIALSRAGLLQVDRLVHDFFLGEHRGARYA
jgi:oxygen-independent coproporphyrinogen-3 oxidase